MPTPTEKSRRNVRLSPGDDMLFRKAAEAVGGSVSEFLIESGRIRAELILADRSEFSLDAKAWEAFSDTLDRPAEARPAVVKVLRRPRPE